MSQNTEMKPVPTPVFFVPEWLHKDPLTCHKMPKTTKKSHFATTQKTR